MADKKSNDKAAKTATFNSITSKSNKSISPDPNREVKVEGDKIIIVEPKPLWNPAGKLKHKDKFEHVPDPYKEGPTQQQPFPLIDQKPKDKPDWNYSKAFKPTERIEYVPEPYKEGPAQQQPFPLIDQKPKDKPDWNYSKAFKPTDKFEYIPDPYVTPPTNQSIYPAQDPYYKDRLENPDKYKTRTIITKKNSVGIDDVNVEDLDGNYNNSSNNPLYKGSNKAKPIRKCPNCKRPECKRPDCTKCINTCKNMNRKLLLAIILISVIGGLLLLMGLAFLIYYLATLGTVTSNGFCMSNYSCLTNSSLYCYNGACVCSANYTSWNSSASYCTNSTPTYTVSAKQKLFWIFSLLNYTTTSITSYNGITLLSPNDVKTINSSLDYYYVLANGNNAIVVFYSNASYAKHSTLTGGNYLDCFAGYCYITTVSQNIIYKLDANFNQLNTYSLTATCNGISYSSVTGYAYLMDSTNSQVKVLSSSLSLQSSFTLANTVVTYTYNGVLYVTTTSNQLLMYSGSTLLRTYTGVCVTGYVQGIMIQSSSGYMVLSCYTDKKVFLWYTDGSSAYPTNLYVTTASNPRGLTVDSQGRVIVTLPLLNRVDILSPF